MFVTVSVTKADALAKVDLWCKIRRRADVNAPCKAVHLVKGLIKGNADVSRWIGRKRSSVHIL